MYYVNLNDITYNFTTQRAKTEKHLLQLHKHLYNHVIGSGTSNGGECFLRKHRKRFSIYRFDKAFSNPGARQQPTVELDYLVTITLSEPVGSESFGSNRVTQQYLSKFATCEYKFSVIRISRYKAYFRLFIRIFCRPNN